MLRLASIAVTGAIFLSACAGQQPQVADQEAFVYADRDGDGNDCDEPPKVPTVADAIAIAGGNSNDTYAERRRDRLRWSAALIGTFWKVNDGVQQLGWEIEGCSGKVTGSSFTAR